MNSFEINYHPNWDGVEKDYETCVRVCDWHDSEVMDCLVDASEVVADLEEIKIVFDYPLSHSVTFNFFSNSGGFTRFEFFRAIYKGYDLIYGAENREGSGSPHGIWGHGMGDLFIEGVRETEPGVYALSMGS